MRLIIRGQDPLMVRAIHLTDWLPHSYLDLGRSWLAAVPTPGTANHWPPSYRLDDPSRR